MYDVFQGKHLSERGNHFKGKTGRPSPVLNTKNAEFETHFATSGFQLTESSNKETFVSTLQSRIARLVYNINLNPPIVNTVIW